MTVIRDFIYLDTERIKSLISQLEEGVVESFSKSLGATSTMKSVIKGGIPLVGGAEGGLEYLWKRDNNENKTLHDFIYTKLEDILLRDRFLKQIKSSPHASAVAVSEFRSSLSSTQFLLIDAHVELSDYLRVKRMIEKFNEIGRFVAWASASSAGKNRQEVEKIFQASLKAGSQGIQIDKQIQEGIPLVIRELLGEKLFISANPFGSECGFNFVGVLRPEFLREEVSNLLFKYGSLPSESWRICCQVASLSPNSRRESEQGEVGQLRKSFSKMFASLRGIDAIMQPYGPRDITVTPIAVYRQ